MWKWFWQPSFPNLSFSTLLWNLRSFISFMLSISSFHLLCQHSNIHWLKINLWIIMIIYYQQKICQVTYLCSSSKSLRMSLWMSYSRVRGAFNQNKTVHGGHVINSGILRCAWLSDGLRISEFITCPPCTVLFWLNAPLTLL